MVGDTMYFKYIFKKTEKIACAVFYTLRGGIQKDTHDHVLEDVESAAQEVVDASLASLSATHATIRVALADLRIALIALESQLRIAHASRYLTSDILAVFVHEIESVYRAMRTYTEGSAYNPFAEGEAVAPARERKAPRPRVLAPTLFAGEAAAEGVPRRERILSFLKDNHGATIKDIMSVVPDCSEKTVQRELIQLIKDNAITREGERRWSTYSVA